MKKLLIRATVNALGLVRGDETRVDDDYTARTMIDAGYWVWLDAPVPTYAQYEVTDAVRERLDANASTVDTFAETFVSVWGAQEQGYEALDEEESDSAE